MGEAQPSSGQTAKTTEPAAGRRLRFASPAMPTAIGAMVLLLGVTSMFVDPLYYLTDAIRLVVVLVYAAVGVVIARRQPRNAVGWLLLGAIFLFLLSSEASSYVILRYHLGHTWLPLGPVAVVLQALWVPAVALFPLVFLLFPDGRLPSRRWRWAFWTYIGLIACVTAVSLAPAIAAAVSHDIHVDSGGNLTTPGQKTSAAVSALLFLLVLSIGLMWTAFVVQKFLSWRRSTGERRQQLKWLACGAAITLVGGILGAVADNVLFACIAALPISIGVGILKYRLYEIDRLISRTLSYAIVTGLVVGVYVAVITLTTKALGFHTPVAVAASTLAAVALFNPLRHRVQRVVDRRFNRARYDAVATVATFTARLRDAVDLETVRSELLEVVNRAVEPAHASVWIRRRQ